jgi:hypothetical protein
MIMLGIRRSGTPRPKALAVIAILGLAGVPLPSLETTLDWRVGKDVVIFRESVLARRSGFSAIITTNIGEYDSLSLDERRSTLEWRRRFESQGTDLVAERSGSQVRVKGTYKGKPYDKTHDFGDLPWYQFQEISYEELFRAKAETSSFWTIDRLSLKPSLFRAQRSETVPIEAMGASVRAIKYDLTVSGVPAFLFTSHFWLRESDGRFLRLAVPPILNLPRSQVDLTSESKSPEGI